MTLSPDRPAGITALSGFFLAGAAISGAAWLWVVTRWEWLEPMWRINPPARDVLSRMGTGGKLLFGLVPIACGAASLGLLRGRVWGHRIAVGLIGANLVGGLVSAVLTKDPRGLAGVPVAAGVLFYLTTRSVRGFFRHAARGR